MVLRKAGWLAGLGLAAGFAALLTGCGNGSSLGASVNTNSRVRVLNALGNVSNGSAIDVRTRFNNTELLNPNGGVAYGSASGYALVPNTQGGAVTNAFVTGTSTTPLATNNSIALDTHDTNTTDGTFTVAVTGVVGQATGNAAVPQILRITDAPPQLSANLTYLRVVNLSPDGGSIVLYNTSNGVTVAVPGFPGNGISYTSASNYVQVTSGIAYSLSVGSGGVTTPVANFTFQADAAYTLFVYGEVNPVNGGQKITGTIVQDAPITSPP